MFSRINRFSSVIFVAFVVALILAITQHSSGPRISSVDNGDELHTQQITLQMNTRLDETSDFQVSVTPQANHSSSTNGRDIIVRFDESLLSNTEYTIAIDNVADTRGKTSTVSHSFTTPLNLYTYIDREGQDGDVLYEKAVGMQPVELYKTDTLYDYAYGNSSLLIIEDSLGEPVLRQVKPNLIELSSISTGTIRSIYGSESGDVYLLTFVRDDGQGTESYIYNAVNSSTEKLISESGENLQIQDASIAADGKTIVYRQTQDFSLYVDDIFDTSPPILLGSASKIVRYFPDNSGVAYERPERNPGFVSILETFGGDVTELDLGLNAFLATLTVDGSAYSIRNEYGGSELTSEVIYTSKDSEVSVIYEPSDTSRVHAIAISNNDEFVSLESSNKPVIYDRLDINSQPIGSFITILNTDGEVIEEASGSTLRWR